MDKEKHYMETEFWKVYKICQSNRYSASKRVYEISNLGRIKKNGIIVAPNENGYGYLKIAGFYLHRAVAELFIPNPNNKEEVDHINGIKSDNRACNLRWVTHEENVNNNLTSIKLHNKKRYQKRRGHSETTKQKISASLKKRFRVNNMK